MPAPRYVKVADLQTTFSNDVEAAARSGAPFIQAGHVVDLCNPFDPSRSAWADRAALAGQLRTRLAGTTSKVLTKWRADLYFENPDLGLRPGWRDDWIAWMPRATVEAALKVWTDAGYTLVWSQANTTTGGTFWDRMMTSRATQLPALYAWYADPQMRLYIGRVFVNQNHADYRKWMLAAAQECAAKIPGDAFLVPSKAGWLLSPQAWHTSPTVKPNAGGILHGTYYPTGGFEAGQAWMIRQLGKKGIKIVLDESPAAAGGPWSWMVGTYKDIPGLLLGEESSWP